MATTSKVIMSRTVVPTADTVLGTSATSISGLSFYVNAGETYEFRARVVYNADATTDGCAFNVTGPASPTDLAVLVGCNNGAGGAFQWSNTNTYDALSAGTDVGLTTDNQAIVEGVITPSAAGTFAIRGIAEGANKITVQGNLSSLTWKRVDWPASA